MGHNLMPPTAGNPRGYFESFDIEGINEDLLECILPSRPKGIIGRFFRSRPTRSQRWLARVPLNVNFVPSQNISSSISKLVEKQPYCFKDPRFSYTLPAWRPFLKNVLYICVFRDPASTVSSILKQCHTAKYLQSLSMTKKRALRVWTLMYSHILEIHAKEGGWLFLHFDQLLEEKGLRRLEDFTGARVDRSFPDPALRRSFCHDPLSERTLKLYYRLCDLAHYEGEKRRGIGK